MRVREPVVAGQFYPQEEARCAGDLATLLADATAGLDRGAYLYGGLVPHAGWMCSGRVAARAFAALAQVRHPAVIVLFGGVHRSRGREAAVFADGRWETPIGPANIDHRLAERILGQSNLLIDDPYAHELEHSLEVQVPFLLHLFPEATFVPIMVPPSERATEVGQAVGRTLEAYQYDALVVGTTDLTHYGPNYGLVSHGVGKEGNHWAKEQNDRRFVELVCSMDADGLVPEALTNRNACSSGAAAATVATVAHLGAKRGVLLEHTTSSEVLGDRFPGECNDSVGYAGIVFA